MYTEVYYFMLQIPSVINILSHIRGCTEEDLRPGYTKESYLEKISILTEQLRQFYYEFELSLSDSYSRQVIMQLKKCKKDTIIEEENTQDNM